MALDTVLQLWWSRNLRVSMISRDKAFVNAVDNRLLAKHVDCAKSAQNCAPLPKVATPGHHLLTPPGPEEVTESPTFAAAWYGLADSLENECS